MTRAMYTKLAIWQNRIVLWWTGWQMTHTLVSPDWFIWGWGMCSVSRSLGPCIPRNNGVCQLHRAQFENHCYATHFVSFSNRESSLHNSKINFLNFIWLWNEKRIQILRCSWKDFAMHSLRNIDIAQCLLGITTNILTLLNLPLNV